ncbi:MAG TPA: DNA-binding protein [Deltaproteobacteria bacterium]|nr:DNA-binding protein [Deltaproteobacteria bacterium]
MAMSKKVVKNWLALAEYDFETAKAMMKSGRYLYVAFTCQQTIEKALKALYVKEKEETPPYTHNLIRLAEELSIGKQIDEETNRFLERLNSYYIQSRYTEEIYQISKSLDKKSAQEILSKTGELFKWLKKHV